uniref:thiol oxidase n=1 Tax=viral metagenome TaxID=1070528 RepID=A0A6C0I2V4_9ZZZZ
MDKLDDIFKSQIISSYENNLAFRYQLLNLFNNHYTQNIKYHILWLFFHSFSFAYPDNPSEEYKIETANFILNTIPKNLGGCGGCQNDYKTYINNLNFNVFRIVSSKQELSTFFVDLHNDINKKKFEQKNKNVTNVTTNFDILINTKNELLEPIFYEYNDVKNKYEQTDFIPLLETKFNINIFNLIENKSLSTFYDIFNKLDFKFADTKYNISFSLT